MRRRASAHPFVRKYPFYATGADRLGAWRTLSAHGKHCAIF